MPDLRERLQEALSGGYQLERELGRGGMATVYLARDLKHDRPVALKVMHPDLAAALGPERFLREVKLVARLQHPHILPVHDSGEAAGQLWYTMPFVRGESLRERLRREVQLPVDLAVELARQVALALDCAHREGVVHRDLKPENILLSDGQALVADFGVAKALTMEGESQLTETGMAVGTPAYMSPEQASGSRVDAKSDVYALGCVLYEMLAGETPYTGPTPQAITIKRLTEPVPNVRLFRTAVPEWVEAAITRALAAVPADRFATTEEFARALAGSPSKGHGSITRREDPGRLHGTKQKLLGAMLLGLVLLSGMALLMSRHMAGRGSDETGPAMLAVLPFKNLGSPSDAYFTDGLTEEITSRLAGVAGLGVISRTSADQYRGTKKTLKQVGRELGVDYVLEGSVRWERGQGRTSRIRVTPQLIRVTDDRHLWTDRYDEDLADVFRVQTSIAEQVTGSLGVALAPRERAALTMKPTNDLSAYDAYLRGNAVNPSDWTIGAERIVSGLRRALEHYQDAVRLDSTFALAYAKLGATHTALVIWQVEPERNAALAKRALTRALELAPDLSEGHASEGFYQAVVAHDTARAMAELERARTLRPNDADLLSGIADLEWFLRGPHERSIRFAERAVVLDPQSNGKALILARMYRDLGRYDDAERLYNQVIARDPRSNGPYIMKAFLYLLRDGDTLRARAVIRHAASLVDSMTLVTAAATTSGIGTWATLGMLDEPYQRALLTLSPAAFGDDTATYGIVKGYAFRARGLEAASRAYYDTAQQVAEHRLDAYPAEPGPRDTLLWTHAVNGRAKEAYATFERLLKEMRIAYFPEEHAWLARIALFAGDTARALTELETRQWGSEITVPWLCVDNFWDPLRSHPRFDQLTAGRC